MELKHEKTAILVERVSEDKGRRTGTYNKFFAGLLQHVYRIPGACLQDFGSRSAGLLEHVCRTSGAGLQDSWGRPAGGGLPDQRLRRAVGLVSE